MTVEGASKVEQIGEKSFGSRSFGETSFGRLASFTKKGLLASQRERDDDGTSTPDTKPTGFGGLFSSAKTPPPVTTPTDEPMTTPSSVKSNINKFLTPSRTFVRLKNEKEELSRLTPSPPSYGLRAGGLNLPLIGEVKFSNVVAFAKTWLRNPKNLVFLVWILAVGVSGAILFMVMVGMLNAAIPDKDARNTWFEVSNQIINALFTMMALYLHPQRCMNLRMLIRWNPSDIVKLRRIFCKDGTRKPHEWGHMLVVVLLLQLNCIAQYALCGLNWGYRRAERPAIGVAICLCTSFGAGAAAGVYNSVSPLGKDFDTELDVEDMEAGKRSELAHESEFVPRTRIYRMLEKRVSFAYREEGSIVDRPEWKGGVCDVTNERTVCVLTALCSFCVFGWNMDRLGFGNRYVHIITFVLFCTAPFWIFDLAALNIQNHTVRNAVGGTGIVLCVFGLFYGGYWRIRMREKYKLPGGTFCCGKAGVTDCFQWLFLPLCSLCQEVRTAEFYDVKDDRFYSRARADPNSLPPSPPSELLASPHSPAPPLSSITEAPSLGGMTRDEMELRAFDSPYREHDHHYRKSPLGPSSPLGQASPSRMGIDAPHKYSVMPSDSPLHSPLAFSPGRTPSPHNQHSISPHVLDPRISETGRFPPADVASNSNDHFARSPLRSPHLQSSSSHPSSLHHSPMQSPNRTSHPHSPLGPPQKAPYSDGNGTHREVSSGSDRAAFQPGEGGVFDEPSRNLSEIDSLVK